MAEGSRVGVGVCWSVPLVRIRTGSWPMWKRDFRWVQKHSNRVMGYRICQLIHSNILIIGEWHSLQIKQLGQAENSTESNVCQRKKYYLKLASIEALVAGYFKDNLY